MGLGESAVGLLGGGLIMKDVIIGIMFLIIFVIWLYYFLAGGIQF